MACRRCWPLPSSTNDHTQSLDTAIEALATPLRMGEGINETALHDLKRLLADIAAGWRTATSVPKADAALLIELYPALTGTVGLYEAEEAERIQQLSEELLELSLSCVTGGN
jgi:hypothetical protein